jgi:hypothetical protein
MSSRKQIEDISQYDGVKYYVLCVAEMVVVNV